MLNALQNHEYQASNPEHRITSIQKPINKVTAKTLGRIQFFVTLVSIFHKIYFAMKNEHIPDNNSTVVKIPIWIAIAIAGGTYIIRLDAHTKYAPDYISSIIRTFDKTGADIVGGPMRATGTSNIQSAIAYCTSTKMGVGNSAFHDENFKGWVDSVYLGAWKKELFQDVGLFDTQMKRNQDDEFHYRAKSKGKKIYLNPEIKSLYYPRDSFNKLFKQYFQYGLYKPLVLRKVHSGAQLRHVIPSLFVFYLLLLPLLYKMASPIALVLLVLYIVGLLYFSLFNRLTLIRKLYCLLVFPIIHISYGSGFICGFYKLKQ